LHDYSLNLSILLSDGSENNYDSSSNGERTTILLHTAALSAGHLWAHLCDGYGKGLLKGSLPCGAIEGESPVPVLVTLTRPLSVSRDHCNLILNTGDIRLQMLNTILGTYSVQVL